MNMISFKNFLYLYEAKAKDVLALYPHLSHLDQNHLSAYGMHLGKITSPNDDPTKIESTIKAFHKDKNALPADKRDITKYKSVDEISGALQPLQQKREAKQATRTIYSDPKNNIEIKHIKTKEACIAGYGGGKTNWCVAATGEKNRFDSYGKEGEKMFTIHHGDKVYGIHEHEEGTIRNEKNEDVTGNMHSDILKAMMKVPELAKVNIMSGNPHITSEHIDSALKHDDPHVREAAFYHPKANITPEHISKALEDKAPGVREAAFNHPNATNITPEHISKALEDKAPGVREAAVRHPNASSRNLDRAQDDHSWEVRAEVAAHPNANPKHISRALDDHEDSVRDLAASNPNNTPETLAKAMRDEDPDIRERAENHPNKEAVRKAREILRSNR